jgi:hypothetical protein
MAIFAPMAGSRIFGAVMSTPGIGPATDGLSGFELFEVSHAVRTRTAVQTPRADKNLRFM